ncbi:histidinol-phosphate transaminase [Kitasatospora sp. HUAS MG31]|uniref:Histidinol-phosphate aminotransferase n=1 Tax=Kitasatospora camelliae TaxID=3156397 RepID=A0AAU8K1S8_9ACTN
MSTAPVTTYRLSANENPYPPLPGVLERAGAALRTLNRYPDWDSTHLVTALADHLDVPAEHVVVGPGSVGVLFQLVRAVAGPGDEVLFAWRSFEAYPEAAEAAGATPVAVPLTSGEDHDLDAMLAAITPRTKVVFVCNPNNPTGTAVRRTDLLRFLDAVPAATLVVLDEAYREFVTDEAVPDGIDLYRTRPNLVVLRTFSKAYGLAGLRVGFAVAHGPVAAPARAAALPFGVSRIAQDAAVESLASGAELRRRVTALVAERTRVQQQLRGQGWDLPDSQANFVWLRLGDRTAAFAAACERAGITVKVFPGEGVRITVAEPHANDAALATTAAWLTAHTHATRAGDAATA